jgi:hypothetical protein
MIDPLRFAFVISSEVETSLPVVFLKQEIPPRRSE